MLPSGSMTSKVVVSPPSRSRPPPDPPPRKAPPLGSLSLREPLEPPDPPDPSDAAPAPALLWFISTSPISRLSSAFHPDVPLPLCFICPSSSLRTSLISDLSSTAWTSSRGDGSCQTSDLKTIRCALSFSSPWTMTVLPKGKIYFTWFWLINLLSDDHLTLLCSPQSPLLSPHPHNNDQWLSSDSRKSLWVHHGNAGVDRFCWELRQVPSEIGVKPILLLTGVEESSSLLSISFQERSHFTPFAITSHIQQVLNMLYPLLSCSHLCNYAVDLKKEMPSSETYGLGIVGLSFIINAVDGVFTSISSEFRHQRGSPTCPNSHVRFILDLAQSHPLLEDCSPVALKQKANQTSSCRGHERTFAPECKNCLMLPYSVASSKGIFPKSPLKRQSSRGAQLKSLGDFDRSWKDFKMFINQPATTKPGICSHFHTMTEYSEKLLESGFINTLWYRYGNIGIESLLLAICHAFSPSLVKLFCCFTGVMMARSSSSSSLVHHCPLKLSFQDKFMKMFSRQGRERSPSTSSFQERTFSPQSLFLRGDSHPVLETWIITDVGISTSHSTTAPFVASPLIAETLASQNAMISAYSYGTFSLSLEALYKKLPVFVHDSNRLTYPFIALVFLSVTSEFYSLTVSSLLVIFV